MADNRELVRQDICRRLRSHGLDDREIKQTARMLVRDAPVMLWDQDQETKRVAWFDRAVNRILCGEPVQYVTGIAHFWSYPFEVTPSVLIPRPETEELVARGIEYLKRLRHNPRVLDIGTGSGCIAITVALQVPGTVVEAWDISPDALEVAGRNAGRLGATVKWVSCDALSDASWQGLDTFDLILSNPPYIAPEEMEAVDTHVLRHEPAIALFGPERDPLLFYRVMARHAAGVLVPGGRVLCECSSFSAEAVRKIFEDGGWTGVEAFRDMQGLLRMVEAQRPE